MVFLLHHILQKMLGNILISFQNQKHERASIRIFHLPSASGMKHLTLIKSIYTERTYGPEPYKGDVVEDEAWFCKKDAVIGGEHRTAYSLWHIETYDSLIETGQRSHYPVIPRPASEAE